MAKSHILGFPRIGAQRELKFALESYWQGKTDADALHHVASEVKQHNWKAQAKLDYLTVGDFSLYDHILDTSALLGAIPPRFKHPAGEEVTLDTYFRVARGQAPTGEETFASEMTKWFDTNYHYIVPELHRDQQFTLSSEKLFKEIDEAKSVSDQPIKAVLVGPVTWLYLGKVKGEDFDRLTLLPQLLELYGAILNRLDEQNVALIQIDEPILALDLELKWREAIQRAYNQLGALNSKLLLTTYFEGLYENIDLLTDLPVAGLHIDAQLGDLDSVAEKWPEEKLLSVGIVNGRNIWANDLNRSLARLSPLAKRWGDRLLVGSSCSLLHSPVDLSVEEGLDHELRSWLSFGLQKIEEISLLTEGINRGEDAIKEALEHSRKVEVSRETSTRIHNSEVVARVDAITKGDDERATLFAERSKIQAGAFKLPLFPTTTIGSFPQTGEIRALRRRHRAGELPKSDYEAGIKEQIKYAIEVQEELDIDVLVHGEAERNDMVEYFGELLDGFAFTRFGWVQSYGSRCVKPPIIYGDVSRPKAMTVEWSAYAQSLTDRHVKGMLTGPVTILSWSFPREDESFEKSAYQIGLALRDEVLDLEAAGVKIIQIDEPAIRELMPLRKKDQAHYLDWAERAFRLSASGVEDATQIHTHMCYSEFNEIIHSIANLDADVITIETSRSDMELLDVFKEFDYPNDIGPGVYDIHSPRIPTVEEIEHLIEKATAYLPKERIWVNPDCGLKTRQWPETKAALKNMVTAAKALRHKYHEA